MPSLKSEYAAQEVAPAPGIEGYQVVQRRTWEKKYVDVIQFMNACISEF